MSKTIFSCLFILFFINNITAQNNPQLSVLLDDGFPYSPQNLAVGDVINYTINLINTGNVDLNQIVVTDNQAQTITQSITVMHPGETITIAYTYTITQTDIDVGSYAAFVTATADYNGQSLSFQSDDADPNSPAGNADPTITWIIQQSALSLILDDQLSYMPQNLAVGDEIHYQLAVSNTGNVNLQNIALFINNALFDQNNTISTLSPGESIAISASHTITASDISLGQVVCQAAGVINLTTNPQVFISSDTDINPMPSATPTITMLNTTTVNRALLPLVNIYPNPAHQSFTISGKDDIFLQEIRIFDIQGHLYQNINLSQSVSSQQIDLSKLSKGLYFVFIKTNKGNLVHRISID